MRENLPIGLRQILEVYRHVRESGYKRTKAIKRVAQTHRVTSQTISSAATRNVGIDTEQLDNYMERGNEDEFCQHLVRHFPSYQDDIEEFFNQFKESKESIELIKKNPLRNLRKLFPDEAKNILNSILLDEVRDYLTSWIDRLDIPEDLRKEIRSLRMKLDKD